MIRALRELWKPGWVEWHGDYYDIPSMTLGPAPTAPVPIYSGGHTDADLRRAARYCDGWIGNAYPWEEGAHYIRKLRGYLREYGRENDPFEIIIGFYAVPSVDLYKTGARGAGGDRHDVHALGRRPERFCRRAGGLLESASVYRESIERFADQIVGKL